MYTRHRKLSIERMEAREMMAGDVTAYVYDGHLYLSEAANQAGGDNSVLISQVAPGIVRVAGNGTLTDGTTSLINGAAFQDFNVTGNLQVDFGGGSDLVVFDATAPPTFQNVKLNLGAPQPVIYAKTAKSSIADTVTLTLPDRDNVMMWGATIRGSLTINTGEDNDWIYVANATIGDGVGTDNIAIKSGAGADTVQLKMLPGQINGSIDVQAYSTLAENDADVVWFDPWVVASGDINIRTGGGNDTIHLEKVTTFKRLSVDAGSGDDTAEMNYIVAVDEFMANLGEGNDSLAINDLYNSNGRVRLLGGNGTDRLTKTGAFPTSSGLEQTGWEYINGRYFGLLDAAVPLNALAWA